MMSTVVGFIGLGQMGLPMAKRLVASGIKVVAQDADANRAKLLSESGPELVMAATCNEDFANVDCLISMLPNSAIVEAVLLQSGVASALKPGTLIIDMSSSEPLRTRHLAEALTSQGLTFIDAPVSGGVKRAEEAKLAIMVGGPREHLDRARPVLEAMGSTIIHVGPVGAGHAAKALNNYVSAAHLVATVEALHAAERFGIDPYVMTDILNASSGRNATSEIKAKQFMLSGTFGSGFALKLMTKDVRIADDLIHAMKSSSVMADKVLSIWSDAADTVEASTDHTAMYRLLGTTE